MKETRDSMIRKYSILTAAALLLAYSPAGNAAVRLPSTTPAPSAEQQVDAFFATLNRTDVPGASIDSPARRYRNAQAAREA